MDHVKIKLKNPYKKKNTKHLYCHNKPQVPYGSETLSLGWQRARPAAGPGLSRRPPTDAGAHTAARARTLSRETHARHAHAPPRHTPPPPARPCTPRGTGARPARLHPRRGGAPPPPVDESRPIENQFGHNNIQAWTATGCGPGRVLATRAFYYFFRRTLSGCYGFL